MLRFWRREDFPEAWLLRATSSTKSCKPSILVQGDDFFIVGRREGRKHALSLLRGAYQLSKSCNSGPRVVQVTDNQLLG